MLNGLWIFLDNAQSFVDRIINKRLVQFGCAQQTNTIRIAHSLLLATLFTIFRYRFSRPCDCVRSYEVMSNYSFLTCRFSCSDGRSNLIVCVWVIGCNVRVPLIFRMGTFECEASVRKWNNGNANRLSIFADQTFVKPSG